MNMCTHIVMSIIKCLKYVKVLEVPLVGLQAEGSKLKIKNPKTLLLLLSALSFELAFLALFRHFSFY